MTEENLSEQIINLFGKKRYEKALKFPNNKINIIYLRKNPIKFRAIIIDEDREFHLIINQKKFEIFHDCPSFLIHSSKKEKVCFHFIKVLLMLKTHFSLKILEELSYYNLTSEDFGSKKKSRNFLTLANNCFTKNNCIEGLNFLNKAIINQGECESIIENYFTIAIENNLFLEFFDFLNSGYENELDDYLSQFENIIGEGFNRFLKTISKYSFFSLLRIIKSINNILDYKEVTSLIPSKDHLLILLNSSNFNERYFSIFFIEKLFKNKKSSALNLKEEWPLAQFNKIKEDMIQFFNAEIDNFCILEKLKLMKKQFEIIGISKEKYEHNYIEYKLEIKELEKKVHLKKFSYLKLLMEKFGINKIKGEFRKKRNTYIINHDKKNLKNPVYHYIIKRIGFFGTNEQVIKSTNIGINYFFIKEMFLDDIDKYPDILYYKKQFWEDLNEYEINPQEAISLLSKDIEYSYAIDKKAVNLNDVMIIEWDLANKPRYGSLVNAYGSQIFIPDQNNRLFHDLKPFDICYCQTTPSKIESSIIKTINVISKCSFKDAINSVAKGIIYIEGFYPLSLINQVLNKEISPFKANEIVLNNKNKMFVPNYKKYVKAFRKFLFDFINKEREYVFNELKSKYKNKNDQILTLLNLNNQLSGIQTDFSEIITRLLSKELNLKEFKSQFITEVHEFIKKILNKNEIGATAVFNLKKMRNTPFFKYYKEILRIRKEELESTKIYKFEDSYDISQILDTYYGKKFATILKLGPKPTVKPDIFKKIKVFSKNLNLNLYIVRN